MKIMLTPILLLLILFNFSFSNWEQVNSGLFKGTFRCFEIVNDKILAGGNDVGMYISSDNGLTWEKMDNLVVGIRALSYNKNKIAVGTWGYGVYISTDEGNSWNQFNNGLSNLYVISILVKGDTIYAGTWGDGIFISTNGGLDWTPTSLKNGRIQYIYSNNNYIWAASDKGLFLSTDGGNNWNVTNLSDIELFTVATNDSLVVAGANGFVYLSTNFGESWQKKQLPLALVQGIDIDGNNIYAATNIGLFVSFDKGKNWVLKNQGIQNINTMSVKAVKNNVLLGTYENGIFLSTDNCNSWKQVGGNITYKIYSLSGEKNYLFAATDKGILFSDNFGESWQNTNVTLQKVNVVHFCNSYVFAGLTNKIFFSKDLGINWKEHDFSNTFLYNILTFACNKNYVFASGEGMFLMYSDFPVTKFTQLNLMYPVYSLLAYDSLLFFGSQSGFYKVPINFTRVEFVGLSQRKVYFLTECNGSLIAATDKGIFISKDFGNNWEHKTKGMPPQEVFSVGCWKNVYFAATNIGIYVSTDYGENWDRLTLGLPIERVNSIAILEPYVFAGTFLSGVFRAKLSNFVSTVDNTSQNQHFVVNPNPTYEEIFIQFSDNIEPRSIQIFNTIGKNLFHLENPQLLTNRTIRISTLEFPFGFYLVVITDKSGKVYCQNFLKY
ncbi:MAG: T9SS type A sorting domain-containing protein [Ignavibacteria bacterium]|nr:T9SS type A sorting domain-containing protein [Ignavibacteria bacterium]